MATLFAALSLAAIIQGSLILARWNRSPESTDLLWSGAGNVLVGVGAGLFGARYFDAPYLVASILANAGLLTGMALLVQGVRAADGFKPVWMTLAMPALIWSAACLSERFRNDREMAIWLFFMLSFWMAATASVHLVRGGLLLAGRRLWLGLWIFIALAVAVRAIDTGNTLPAMVDRYASSGWYAIYLCMCAAAAMGIGYINLALSDSLPHLCAFLDNLQRELPATPKALDTAGPGAGNASGHVLWSLRLDRLFMGRKLQRPFEASDIADIRSVILTWCPHIVAVRRAGVDRLIWLDRGNPEQVASRAQGMATALGRIAGRPTFPAIALSFGAAPVGHGDLLAVAATADRHAVRIRGS